MQLKHTLENLLFVAARPLTFKTLAKRLKVTEKEVQAAAEELKNDLAARDGGIVLIRSGNEISLGSHPGASAVIAEYLKEEQRAELTRPSLETLTIIAYRGPVTKPEIELIRGVNCSVILRNLLIRGLIREEKRQKTGDVAYSVTVAFLEWLGVASVSELPDFDKLASHELFEQLINDDGKNDTRA